jgi:hypothetical protein
MYIFIKIKSYNYEELIVFSRKSSKIEKERVLMGADMKRALIKLYDKLHLSHPMWSVRKICVEISEIFSVS